MTLIARPIGIIGALARLTVFSFSSAGFRRSDHRSDGGCHLREKACLRDVTEGVCNVLAQQGPLLNAFMDKEPTHRSDQLVYSVLVGGQGTELLNLSFFTLPLHQSQLLTASNKP